ncbi:unnamed protein product [Adineta steineri]|uniref:G-protein coupled receptors family 1 profile domain-containing protein n=2 Tax=Adineta steineri TaxID=433720 RepID=A0A815LQ18_9BILA|nr:unnamed protein product [Adineta steineri]CAF1410498.1 unnamed protein product [Adineta steineri]
MDYDEENSSTITEYSIDPKPILFSILLFVEITSILCSLIILIYFFFHWKSMINKALQNHVVFLLIIVSLLYTTLDLPFTLNSQRIGYDYPQTVSFCRWWYWIDWTLLVNSLYLTAIGSIQRHILIFHNHLLQINRIRLKLHYIPLLFSIIYPATFYLITIYFYPCEMPTYDYVQYCPYPCYCDNLILYTIDYMINTVFPVVIIIIANILLVCRVIHSMKKIRRNHFDIWKRQKKLTLQLLSISLLYIIGWGPVTVVSVIQMFFMPNIYDDIPDIYYVTFSIYFICTIQSFISLFALPELLNFIKKKLKQILSKETVTPVQTILPTR